MRQKIMAVILVIPVTAAIALWLGTLLGWIQQLDEVLDAGLFATITGLALTAATFLYGRMVQLKERELEALATARREWNSLTYAARMKDECLNIEKVSEVEKEAVRKVFERMEDVDSRVHYCKLLLAYKDAQEKVVHVSETKQSLTNSFRWFLCGLGLSLTLDLWSDAAATLSHLQEPTSLSGLLTIAYQAGWAFVDSAVSLIVLGVGMYWLWVGSARLGNS